MTMPKTTTGCATEIGDLLDRKHRYGLTPEEWDRLDALKAEKKRISDLDFAEYMARWTTPKPTARYYDDDAPGGVTYDY